MTRTEYEQFTAGRKACKYECDAAYGPEGFIHPGPSVRKCECGYTGYVGYHRRKRFDEK